MLVRFCSRELSKAANGCRAGPWVVIVGSELYTGGAVNGGELIVVDATVLKWARLHGCRPIDLTTRWEGRTVEMVVMRRDAP